MILYASVISVVISSFVNGATVTESCDIPGGLKGRCIDSKQCEPYSTAIETRPLQNAEFLRHVQCHMEGKISYVCCTDGTQYNFTEIEKPKLKRNRSLFSISSRLGDLEMDQEACGQQLEPNRIFGGIVTGIDEFPWMALMVYGRKYINGKPVLACGGAVINRRYVLTAAHCVSGSAYEVLGKVVKVRLGEYDLEAERDCVVENDYQDCADPVVEASLDQIVIHPGYSPKSKDQENDIALIRLDRDLKFTDFIKPICLPDAASTNYTVRSGEVLQVAGWGKTQESTNSPVKLKTGLPVVNRDDCQKAYKRFGNTITDKQICAGGESGKDSCKGDSGGPLMVKDYVTGTWIISGVVSIGPDNCGQSGLPGVYTDVKNYVTWIKENIKF